MRPISALAEALNNILDLLTYGVWFGVLMAGAKYLTDRGEISLPYPWIPAGLIAGVVAGQAVKPLRQAASIAFSRSLARSRIRLLMEMGVWRLLRVAYRFWPQNPVTDFIG